MFGFKSRYGLTHQPVGRLIDKAGQPRAHGGGDRSEVGPQAVVASYLNHSAPGAGWGHPEAVSLALHDQSRDLHLLELGQAALWRRPRPGRRLQGKRQAEHADGPARLGGATGHPRAGRPTTDDERQPVQFAVEQVVDHRRPGGVELACRSGSPSPGYAVGLLDERDVQPYRSRYVRHRNQVPRSHPSPGPVPEHQGGAWLTDWMEVDNRPAVRSVHFESRQPK